MRSSACTKQLHIFLSNTEEKLLGYRKCQKIEVWRRLGRVMTKNLFAQTIPDKIFDTK